MIDCKLFFAYLWDKKQKIRRFFVRSSSNEHVYKAIYRSKEHIHLDTRILSNLTPFGYWSSSETRGSTVTEARAARENWLIRRSSPNEFASGFLFDEMEKM